MKVSSRSQELISQLFSSEHKICLVGLDNAGKTTILYQFLMNEVVHTSPTIGSNVEEVGLQEYSKVFTFSTGGLEQHPLRDVGPWWPGVSEDCLEHLLLKHGVHHSGQISFYAYVTDVIRQ